MSYEVIANVAQRNPHAPPPDPIHYEQEIYQKGLQYEKPPFSFHTAEWESAACARLSAESKGYLQGNAGTGETARKNREAFGKWSLLPSRLIETSQLPDLSTSVVGKSQNFPLAVAPVGVQRIFNPDGERASAAAAAKEGVTFIMSTAASASIEEVAEANGEGGSRWFQLYWPSNEHEGITASMLQRAEKAGFGALVVTLDTFILGWRPSDMDNGYNPFLRSDNIGVAIGFTDPVFRAHFKKRHGVEVEENLHAAAAEWTSIVFPGHSHSWDDLKVLQKYWKGPIVLKGIQSPADALRAVEAGVQGIVVSNHGGRQVDGSVSSLGMLPKVVEAVGNKLDILFDSGVRNGADIAKALALGAKMCLIGRPYIYGLVLGGELGVQHVLRSLLGELQLTLHLAGIKSVKAEELHRGVLIRESDV